MNGIIDSISNLLMPLCSVWIVNKFVNNSFEKILKELNGNLPLKRINEFAILKYLLN